MSFIFNPRPGLYELVGSEAGDGTLLAAMIAKAAGGPVVWITSPSDHGPGVFDAADFTPTALYQVAQVAPAFVLMRALDAAGVASLIVLDSLAGLSSQHPGARTIANEVKRGICLWEPRTPILVVNQVRTPAPPGGVYWRGAANSRSMVLCRAWPLLLSLYEGSEFEGHPRFLIWYPNYKPELRPLRRIEWRYFFRGGLPGYQVTWESDFQPTIRRLGIAERQRPWLIRGG